MRCAVAAQTHLLLWNLCRAKGWRHRPSESILAKSKSYKLPVKKTKKELQWSTASGILTTNTKIATSFSFPELHANKLINQYLHVVDLNIDRYDIIIGRDLIRSLGIDIHGGDMTIHWDDAAIPWRLCNVLSFFGIRNVGAPHWKRLTLFITLRYSSRSSSCSNVTSCMHGTGKGFP